MAGLNRWQGIGNLTEDSELRVTAGGQSLLRFRIACSEKYKNRDGDPQKRVEYVTCIAWGPRAEALKWLSKGMLVYVDGGLRSSSYETRTGEKRYKTEVSVDNLQLLNNGAKPEEQQEARDADDLPF